MKFLLQIVFRLRSPFFCDKVKKTSEERAASIFRIKFLPLISTKENTHCQMPVDNKHCHMPVDNKHCHMPVDNKSNATFNRLGTTI